MPKIKPASLKEQELNRWCIEMALRWPVVHVPASLGNAMQQAQGLGQFYQQAQPARDVDADIIGRANKIAAWMKESH